MNAPRSGSSARRTTLAATATATTIASRRAACSVVPSRSAAATTECDLAWNAVAGRAYCVQAKGDLKVPWSAGISLACLVATNTVGSLEDASVGAVPQRFYRVARQ